MCLGPRLGLGWGWRCRGVLGPTGEGGISVGRPGAVLILWIICLCCVFVVLSRLFIAA